MAKEIDLGGVKQYEESLKPEPSEDIYAPKEEIVPTEDQELKDHVRAAVLDHPINSVKLSHLERQIRALLEQVLESGSSGVPTGTILAFGGGSAPAGYLLCDGISLLRSVYPQLFAAIGTAYGTADGTHFNAPYLQGQFLRGHDDGEAVDPDAVGRTALKVGGATGDNIGSKQVTATKKPVTDFTTGNQSEDHVHITDIGSHDHVMRAYTGLADTSTPGTLTVLADPSIASIYYTGASNTDMRSGSVSSKTVGNKTSGTQTGEVNHIHTVTGGGDNESRPPNVTVNFIIKT